MPTPPLEFDSSQPEFADGESSQSGDAGPSAAAEAGATASRRAQAVRTETPSNLQSSWGPGQPPLGEDPKVWRVLVVEDDHAMLQVTRLALQSVRFRGCPVELHFASSATEAHAILSSVQKFAVILLDVVMETDDAGLTLVRFVRDLLGDERVRIVIRTGQSGLAPEARVLEEYDVDDYRDKTDLSARMLRSAVLVHLRAYERQMQQWSVHDQLIWINQCTHAFHAATSVRELAGVAMSCLTRIHRLQQAWLLESSAILRGPQAVVEWTALGHYQGNGLAEPMEDVLLSLQELSLQALARPFEVMQASSWLLMATEPHAGVQEILLLQFDKLKDQPNWAHLMQLFARSPGLALRNLGLLGESNILARLPRELPVPLLRVDRDGCVLFANASAQTILDAWSLKLGGRVRSDWVARVRDALARGSSPTVEEVLPQAVFEMTIAPVAELDYVNIFGRDVTENRKMVERLRHAAFHDELTGLYNRAFFGKTLDSMIAEARAVDGQLGLILVDLDNFKQINDGHGHPVGDAVLQAVAWRLRSHVRHGDVVARLGGDEFAVLTRRLTSAEDLAALAERLRNCVVAPIQDEGVPARVSLTASLGLTIYPRDAGNGSDLMRCADLAMYHAKRGHVHGVSGYDGEVHRRVRRQGRVEELVRQALQTDQLEVHYQPVIDLVTGQLESVEALARIRGDDDEWLPPSEFILAAEEAGVIDVLGKMVLTRALADLKLLRQRVPSLRLAVNASARQLSEVGFVNMLDDLLARSGVTPASLSVELTESTLIYNSNSSLSALQQLRDMGVELSLDDFGTGYSSLSYLTRLPVDKLKIDRSFVCELIGDAPSQAVVRAIVTLGRSLGIQIVAEGVEQASQLSLVTELGCQYAQGFHICRPLPVAALDKWLAQRSCSVV